MVKRGIENNPRKIKSRKVLESDVTNKYMKLRKRVGASLIILIIALIAFSWYYLFYYPKPCKDSNCFINAMTNCKRVSWIKEDQQASWLYTIVGSSKGDTCKVEVKLMKMKEGTIDSESLQEKTMLCTVQKGETRPEKHIEACSGVLKEEMQDIIIQRLHNHILKNIGDIKEEF